MRKHKQKAEKLKDIKAINTAVKPPDPTDIDGFLRSAYQNIIISTIEEAKLQVLIFFLILFIKN